MASFGAAGSTTGGSSSSVHKPPEGPKGHPLHRTRDWDFSNREDFTEFLDIFDQLDNLFLTQVNAEVNGVSTADEKLSRVDFIKKVRATLQEIDKEILEENEKFLKEPASGNLWAEDEDRFCDENACNTVGAVRAVHSLLHALCHMPLFAHLEGCDSAPDMVHFVIREILDSDGARMFKALRTGLYKIVLYSSFFSFV